MLQKLRSCRDNKQFGENFIQIGTLFRFCGMFIRKNKLGLRSTQTVVKSSGKYKTLSKHKEYLMLLVLMIGIYIT